MKFKYFFVLANNLLALPCNCTCNTNVQPNITQANDFECIDDTKFKHFISSTEFVVKECPPGLCFTRVPKNKNPCIGKTAAILIDSM
jgi:hypothetical protein